MSYELRLRKGFELGGICYHLNRKEHTLDRYKIVQVFMCGTKKNVLLVNDKQTWVVDAFDMEEGEFFTAEQLFYKLTQSEWGYDPETYARLVEESEARWAA